MIVKTTQIYWFMGRTLFTCNYKEHTHTKTKHKQLNMLCSYANFCLIVNSDTYNTYNIPLNAMNEVNATEAMQTKQTQKKNI